MAQPALTFAMAALLLTTMGSPSAAHAEDEVTPAKNELEVTISKTQQPEWLGPLADDEPANEAQAPISHTIGNAQAPDCASAFGAEGCQPVERCEPDSESPTGYLLIFHGINAYTVEGPCTPEQQASGPRITPGRVLQAFRRIPLPAATLDIQPPRGKTLVNLDTIFSTTTHDLDRTITLLGRRVQLRITPTSYTWHHGDGTTQTSHWPGRPWQEDLDMTTYLTHAYTDAHVTVHPSVDVTYTADYRIGNGPWQPVDGTVTIQGPPSTLRILEARPVLTGAGR